MAIIAPAQSSLRVMPTAPAVDTAAFSQIPNPAAGMQMFEQAAKLPLLMEQIKMEQQKNKVETEKLKAAKLQAEYQVNNFDRITQQQEMLAELERQAKLSGILANEASAEAARATADARRAEMTFVPTVGSTVLANETVTPAPTTPAPAPLADDGVGSYIVPQKGGYGVAPEAPAVAAAAPAVNIRDRAKVQLAKIIPVGVTAEQVAAEEENKDIRARFGDKVPARVYSEQVLKARGESRERLRPQVKQFEFEQDGVPMKVAAEMVGSRVVSLKGEPYVDVKGLHERVPTQKIIDETVAKDLGEMLTGAGDRALQTNISNLGTAKQILQSSDTATGKWVSLLPDRARILFGMEEGIIARDAVRQVVQQSLRQTLGAQFARVEGELMMERAFDARMDEKENLRRVNLLVDETLRYAAIKAKAAEYMKANGTMYGYQGESLEAAADGMAARLNSEFLTKTAPSTETTPKSGAASTPLAERDSVKASIDAVLGRTVRR